MKFNIADPRTGAQHKFEVDDDKKCAIFYDKRMGAEIECDNLGEGFKGYIFKIMGGNDKQGFPMKQGVLVKGRVRLLLTKGHSTYRPRRKGERKRKSVRGCIVGPDLRAISLSLIKEGEKPIAGFSEVQHPRRVGPKRVTRIRRLFALEDTRKDDKNAALVKKNVIRRTWTAPSGKTRQKAPKIQRISTPERRRRRRLIKLTKRNLWKTTQKSKIEYENLLADWGKEKKRAASERKKSRTESLELKQQKEGKVAKPAEKKVEKKTEVKKPAEKKVEKKQDPKEAKKTDEKKAPAKKAKKQ